MNDMMNADEMTAAEWDALAEREKEHILQNQFDEAWAEMSPAQRVRLEWENGS